MQGPHITSQPDALVDLPYRPLLSTGSRNWRPSDQSDRRYPSLVLSDVSRASSRGISGIPDVWNHKWYRYLTRAFIISQRNWRCMLRTQSGSNPSWDTKHRRAKQVPRRSNALLPYYKIPMMPIDWSDRLLKRSKWLVLGSYTHCGVAALWNGYVGTRGSERVHKKCEVRCRVECPAGFMSSQSELVGSWWHAWHEQDWCTLPLQIS